MKTVRSGDREFREMMTCLERRGRRDASAVEEPVAEILREVQQRGDAAVAEYTERFDRIRLRPEAFLVGRKEVRQAYRKVPRDLLALFEEAAARIRSFHARQRVESWFEASDDGTLLGQLVTPIGRVGLYVPGGKAAYPSSVLMNAVPAQVAGVRSLAICTPAPGGVLNPHVLVVADLLGLEEIYRIGGAQAVGAMAFGTATIPRVDKIVGPGNIYVATAKKLVFGEVDIDMVAGPSEILILADAGADPRHVAADLLSQAEHDELATCVLVTDSPKLAARTLVEIERQVDALPRPQIARGALRGQGLIMVVRDLREGMDVANVIAPEHLELLVEEPLRLLPFVRNAGSVFLGAHTPEALGDYLAGPNHVLPTGGTARFFSTLGTPDFQKRSNIMAFSKAQFDALAAKVVRFARLEGLEAHARSVLARGGKA
ncbi:MAG TPA: histidinol dehydrogenase [Candidatus Methanoperedens sp.]|nr:histidinol dehydrogenase [Candidatus Methanoperedens sp.]